MENGQAMVLVVQDDDQATSLARHALGEEGYDVLASRTNAEAWSLLVEYHPPLAIVDLRLAAGDDGFEFIEHVRADRRFAEMPIIVLTGVAEEAALKRVASLGCDYLNKPFSSSALVEKVWAAFRRLQRAQRGVADQNRAATSTVPTVLLLPDYRVSGYLHLPQEIQRFSDALESLMRDGREFVLVTDAVISSVDGSHELSKVRFIGVAKSHIRGVFPVE
ncbi:MAG TPA: response regulator [Actinomycetota bacterium]|nr:response regulator [Actinomycetota bacterium]